VFRYHLFQLVILLCQLELALVRPLVSRLEHLSLLLDGSIHLLGGHLDLAECLHNPAGDDLQLLVVLLKLTQQVLFLLVELPLFIISVASATASLTIIVDARAIFTPVNLNEVLPLLALAHQQITAFLHRTMVSA